MFVADQYYAQRGIRREMLGGAHGDLRTDAVGIAERDGNRVAALAQSGIAKRVSMRELSQTTTRSWSSAVSAPITKRSR